MRLTHLSSSIGSKAASASDISPGCPAVGAERDPVAIRAKRRGYVEMVAVGQPSEVAAMAL